MLPSFSILLLSGGLDSTMLLHESIEQGMNVHSLIMLYGQRHIKETTLARRHCQSLGVKYTEIELHKINGLFKRSALTDGDGTIVVPNRNAVFLHIAAGIAASQNIERVLIGCNRDDQADFPDCTWSFIEAMNATLKAAKVEVEICAPYIGLTKRQIVMRAREKGWPYHDTLSCYEGTECGKCDACKKRIAAILET